MNLDPIQVQAVRAFDDDNVFVKGMHMFRGGSVRAALPKGDLAAIATVENIAFDSLCISRRGRDPIGLTCRRPSIPRCGRFFAKPLRSDACGAILPGVHEYAKSQG